MKKNLLLLIAIAILAITNATAVTTVDGLQTQQPDGTLKTYDRAGYSYYVYNDYVRRGAQTGTISIVFADANEVYIKDPLAKAPTGVWVKGTLSTDGKTITLPLGQVIAHDTEINDDVVLGMLYYDEDEEEVTTQKITGNISFTIDANGNISINGTSRYTFFGAVWKTSKAWAEFGDYQSKYTLKEDDDVPVVPPTGLQTETYRMSCHTYVSESNIKYNVELGFDGNDAYLKGAYSDLPNAWIKGVKNGNTVTFPTGQYLAPTTTGTTNYYMIATNHQNTSEIQDFVLTYDEEADQYTSPQYLVLNTAKKTVYLVEALDQIVIKKVAEGGVYPVPYEGTFTGGQNDFTVIDANNDKVTWTPNKMNGTMEYNFSMQNKADDWLISPKVKLEKGKTYLVTVTARSMAGMLEKFEVKMGKENTVAGMTTTVMPVQNVQTEDFTPFSAQLTADADGAYHFGIHAVSDADNFGLYVSSITVEDVVPSGITTIATETENKAVKCIEDGQIVIKVNGKKYNTAGALIK